MQDFSIDDGGTGEHGRRVSSLSFGTDLRLSQAISTPRHVDNVLLGYHPMRVMARWLLRRMFAGDETVSGQKAEVAVSDQSEGAEASSAAAKPVLE